MVGKFHIIYKVRGMKLGRQAGSKNKNCKLDDKKNLILTAGFPVVFIKSGVTY